MQVLIIIAGICIYFLVWTVIDRVVKKRYTKKDKTEFAKYKRDKKTEVWFLMSSLIILTLIFILPERNVAIRGAGSAIALLLAYGIGEWHVRQRNKRKQSIEFKNRV